MRAFSWFSRATGPSHVVLSIAFSARPVRVRFDGAFYAAARSHHLTKRDVERALRWPKSIDDLTDDQAFLGGTVTVWLATSPPALPVDPSSILVVARGRRGDPQGFDAWRVYHRELDLSRSRSAREAFAAFLGRYGLDLRLGAEARRLFLSCAMPMAATANTDGEIAAASEGATVKRLTIRRRRGSLLAEQHRFFGSCPSERRSKWERRSRSTRRRSGATSCGITGTRPSKNPQAAHARTNHPRR